MRPVNTTSSHTGNFKYNSKAHRDLRLSTRLPPKLRVLAARNTLLAGLETQKIRQTGLMAELKHKILIQINHYRL